MAQPLTIYKLTILYMLSRVDYPLTNAQFSEFLLEKGYTDYFHLQQSLNEMFDAHLLLRETTHNTTYYRLTEDGRSTLDYLIRDLPPGMRREADRFLEAKGERLQEEAAAVSNYYRTDIGAYDVRLQLHERGRTLLALDICVPSESAASAICVQWKEKSRDAYEQILDYLL